MDIFEQIAEMKREEGWKEGKKQGQIEARETIVRNLLNNSRFSDEKIASIATVSVAFVARTRRKLSKKPQTKLAKGK